MIGSGSPAFDADNYACVKGSCQYLGCNTDFECGALAAGMVCRKAWGSPTAYCLQGCKAPKDCASTVAAYDASHFACDDGLCRYLGCAGDVECQQYLQKPNAVCKAP